MFELVLAVAVAAVIILEVDEDNEDDEGTAFCCWRVFVNVPTIILATPFNAASTDCWARVTIGDRAALDAGC